MAILHLSIRLSEPCIYAIFKPTIFKFWIFIEGYKRINDTFGILDSFSINFEIELGFPSSQIKIFLRIFDHILRIFPIPLRKIYVNIRKQILI
jgi:hypothetical protein